MIRFPFGRGRDEEERPRDGAADAAGGAPSDPVVTPFERLRRAQTGAYEAGASEAGASEAARADALEAPAESVATLEAESGAVGAPSLAEQQRMVEAMLFASDKPLSTAELASRMPIGCDAAVAVRRLEEAYAGRGVQLVRIAAKWAFRTAPDLSHLLSAEVVEQRKLSKAAIETLAIIAYHQPVTRAEIEEIRQVGVSKGTVDLLMEVGWIKLGRRRQTPGRPVTFVTTDAFLDHFGLESLKDLPRLEELRQAGLFEARPPVGFQPSPEELARLRADAEADEADDDAEAAQAEDRDLLI